MVLRLLDPSADELQSSYAGIESNRMSGLRLLNTPAPTPINPIVNKVGEVASYIANPEEWNKRKYEITQEVKQIPAGVKGLASSIASTFKFPKKNYFGDIDQPTKEEDENLKQGLTLVGNLTNEFLWRPITGWYQSLLKETVHREANIDDYVKGKKGFQSLPRAMVRGLLGIEDVRGKDVLEAAGIPKTEDMVLKHPILAMGKEIWGGSLDVMPLPILKPVESIGSLLKEGKYASADNLAMQMSEKIAKAKYEKMGNPLGKTWEELPQETKNVAIKIVGETPINELNGKSISDIFYEHPYKSIGSRLKQKFNQGLGMRGTALNFPEIPENVIKELSLTTEQITNIGKGIFTGLPKIALDRLKEIGIPEPIPTLLKPEITPVIAPETAKTPIVETPTEGGKVEKAVKAIISKEDLTPDIMDRLTPSEVELVTKRIIEGKSLSQTAKEIDALSAKWVESAEKDIARKITEIKSQPIDEGMSDLDQEMQAQTQQDATQLRSHLSGKLKFELKSKGEYASLKHLNWLFAKEGEGGVEPDVLVSELQEMGYPVNDGDEVRELINTTFAKQIWNKAEQVFKKGEQRIRQKATKLRLLDRKPPKPVVVKRPETLVGRGTVINQRQDTDKSIQRQISTDMPFTLLGNKAEVLSRLSQKLKDELINGITHVFDLFGGAKGYRVGLFKDIPPENYQLNEFSDERYNYYKNMQDPAKVEEIKADIRIMRAELMKEIASAFGINAENYSSEALRQAVNKWLQRGLFKERYQFARDVIQHFGNKLLMQAVADNFQSPESSAIYYFLENTSIYGISKDSQGKYTWTQGVIRTSQDKSTIRDTMARIVEADTKLGTELSRDGKMPVTQMDAWAVMDQITAGIQAGKIDPTRTVVLVDPQYLNPTAAGGTYTVGTKDTTWEGHKDNLETHLLPLAKTGVRIIYTNNEDINLNRWLRANKLPYNVEESIGVVAEKGGRDEIISFINYKLPKEFTTRGGIDVVGTEPGYLGEEITGESERFAEWLRNKQELESQGEKHVPSFGQEWTSQQRKDIYIEALKRGMVYTDSKGKIHNGIRRFVERYPGASYEQIKEYIGLLNGDARHPPKFPVTMQLVPYEWSGPFNDLTVYQGMPLSGLDPVRACELVDGKSYGPCRKYIVEPARDRERKYKMELKKILDELTRISNGMRSKSEGSNLVFKYIEDRLTSEEIQKMTPTLTNTADYMRRTYKNLLDRVNEVRTKVGKEPILERKNYITYLQELNLLDDFFQGLSNIPDEALKNIPIFIKANSQFFRFALQRLGGPFKEDSVDAFRSYINKAIPIIHNTDAVRQARALAQRLPNNAYKYFTQYINEVLIMRKPRFDQDFISQPMLGALSWMRNKMGKGAILGNIASVLYQPFTLPNITSSAGIKFTCKAIVQIFTPGAREFAEANSHVLQGRIFEIDFDPTLLKKADTALAYLMQTADREMVRIAFLAAYQQACAGGADTESAIRFADDMAFKTQSGFNLSELPPAFRSKFATTFLQFQNTVNSGFNYMKFDLGKDPKTGERSKWNVFKAALTLMGTFLALNKLYDALGFPTPVDSAYDLVPVISISEYGPPITYSGPMAMLSLFMTSDPYEKSKAWNRLKNLPFLFISGGNQLRKTWSGVEANIKGGKFNKKGKMMFPIRGTAEQLRSAVFGPYQTKAGKKYIENRNKGKKSSTVKSPLRLLR